MVKIVIFGFVSDIFFLIFQTLYMIDETDDSVPGRQAEVSDNVQINGYEHVLVQSFIVMLDIHI